MTATPTRFWEIDTYRGVAIILMIIYHVLFDLTYLNIYQINLHQFAFRLYLYPIGTSFLLLVGISLTLSYSRHQDDMVQSEQFKRIVFRGLKIFSFGMLITVTTWFLIGDGFIVFGVLHCIGLSIILSYPFLRYQRPVPIVILGLLIVILGIILRFFVFDFSYLLWLGFIPRSFYTLDYFPLFPWFGVILIGISLGKQFYKNRKRRFHINDYSHLPPVRFLSNLGKHSLLIYLLHQPIILAILVLIA